MASGIKKVQVYIAVDHNETPIILDIPLEDFDITLLDGNLLEDQPFTNLDIVPKEVGVYKLDCDLYWDDRINGFYEQTDSDYEFKIVNVVQLYKVAI